MVFIISHIKKKVILLAVLSSLITSCESSNNELSQEKTSISTSEEYVDYWLEDSSFDGNIATLNVGFSGVCEEPIIKIDDSKETSYKVMILGDGGCKIIRSEMIEIDFNKKCISNEKKTIKVLLARETLDFLCKQ